MKIYTRRGDDGTTSLYSGERVAKTSLEIELVGAIDEAQATLGLARAECERGSSLDETLVSLERDLWILMAEVATTPQSARLGRIARVDQVMVDRLERAIDLASAQGPAIVGFAVPGETRVSAKLDFSRTVIRRAERIAVGLDRPGSLIVVYLNRLSDLAWALARATEETTRTNAGARTTATAVTLGADGNARPDARTTGDDQP